MRKKTQRKKKKARRIKVAQVFILCISLVMIITVAVTVIQKNFSAQKDVNADVAEESDKVNTETSKEEQKSGQDHSKKSGLEVNDNLEKSNSIVNNGLEKDDPVADDVAFVEKYLSQQYNGIKPDGVDGRKIAYLTFDDGPSETVTPQILDILKTENVKATFFVVGKEIEKSSMVKQILKREFDEGHSIGNHTYSHNYKYLYPKRTVNVDNFLADVEKTNDLIRSAVGKNFSIRTIRFPGGHMSWNGMKAMDDILASKDYHQVDWNALSKDAEGKFKKAPELLNEVINTVKNREKAVILMHDTYGKEETAKALPEIIKYLREQGFEFRTMK